MGLHLQISNSLSTLSERLTALLSENRSSIFIPDTIVAQTEGMHIWLKEQIAQKNGIASNIKFVQPNDIILLVYKLLGGKFPKSISRDNLIWILFQLLQESQFIHSFPEQAKYIGKDLPDEHFKRIGLATKVADLFDQYQIYRPDTIKRWNQPLEGRKITDWQEYLWRRTKEFTHDQMPDKTEVERFISEKLVEYNSETLQNLQKHLPHIYLFGLSIITKFHIEILDKLSKVIDIHNFLINPSPEWYWVEDINEKANARRKLKQNILEKEDIELIGNDLLTSWGRVTSTTLRLLYNKNDDLFNIDEINIVRPDSHTLLGAIQTDIFNNENEYTTKLPSALLDDQTLAIHSHYTIAREVEGLYQYLIHITQNSKETIRARDIAIFATDIDAYAPYIQAIFENGPVKFRFKIADTEITNGDTIFSVLQKILELNSAYFTSENVLQIIESKYVISMFGFTDLDKIRQAVKAANIRFGIKGEKEDETYLVSWLYGLKRMMYGICMSDESLYNDISNENFYPIDIIEGYDSQNIILFIYFVELLIQNIQTRHRTRNLIEWNKYIMDTVNTFIYIPGEELDEDYQILERKNKELNEDQSIYTEELSFDIFAFNFIETLQRTKRNALFLKDGITFCSLIPMRSIPFKIIGMLGMDGDHFPRKEDNLSFSKMVSEKQLGDRDVKENDKNLFLETVMSAQNYLYLSYIGKSIKDNKEINTSILIDELLNYIDKRMEVKDAKKHIFYQHPLYTNSKKYNLVTQKDATILYKYSLKDTVANTVSIKFSEDVETGNVSEEREIDWTDLAYFFQDAAKTYYTKVLGIYYNEEKDVLPEEEIFDLNRLQKIQIEQEILDKSTSSDDNTLINELKLKGQLPLKNPGILTFKEVEENLQPLYKRFQNLANNKEIRKIEFSFKLLNFNIKGELSNIFNEDIIIISYTDKEEDKKKLIYAYILSLIIAYNKLEINIHIIGKNINLVCNANTISKEIAKEKLENLLHLFERGEKELLPYSVTLILKDKWYKELIESGTGKNLVRIIAKDAHAYHSQYLQMAFNDGLENSPTLNEDWIQYHEQLIFPMQDAFQDIKEEDV